MGRPGRPLSLNQRIPVEIRQDSHDSRTLNAVVDTVAKTLETVQQMWNWATSSLLQ